MQAEATAPLVADADEHVSALEFQLNESLDELQARLEERAEQEVECRFQSMKDGATATTLGNERLTYN